MRRLGVGRKLLRAGLALGVLAAVSLWAVPARASYVSAVTVTSNELHGGPDCLDRFGLLCPRPDLFARAIINDDLGTFVCPEGPVTTGAENVVADQVLCSGTQITGNFTVTFELWDSDEAQSPGARQQGDLAAGEAKGWTTPAFFPGIVGSRRFTTSGAASTAVFTVTVAPVTTTITVTEPSTSGSSFDPSIGERVPIRGTLTKAARLQVSITVAASGETFELTTGSFYGSPTGGSIRFDLDWDGRRTPGALTPMPEGDYTVTVSDVSHLDAATRPTVSRAVHIIKRSTSVLAITSVLPAATWDLADGALTVTGLTGQAGTFWAEVAPLSSAGPCLATVARTAEQQRPAGALELTVDGFDASHTLLAAGSYCVSLAGRDIANAAVTPSKAVHIAVLTRATGLEAYAATNPAVPAAMPAAGRGTVQIVANALDTSHTSRHVATMTIEASAAGAPGVSVTATPRVLKTCLREQQCIVDLPADIAAAPAVAYRVLANERNDVPSPASFTGTWRITDLNPAPQRVWRASVPAVVNGTVTTRSVSSQIDVVYYPGTGYELTDAPAAGRFAAAVGDNLWQLLGAGGTRFVSSVATNWDLVALWVANIPVPVLHTDGTSPGSDEDLCEWSGFTQVSFGEAHGLLHTVDCRDNTWWNVFSANDPRIGWHELHHAAYNEDDEYCCDGGYNDGVNVYNSLASCLRQGSNPATCTMITKTTIVNGIPTPTSVPWFRSDTAANDVMITNRVEDLDDLRAANAAYARCRINQC